MSEDAIVLDVLLRDFDVDVLNCVSCAGEMGLLFVNSRNCAAKDVEEWLRGGIGGCLLGVRTTTWLAIEATHIHSHQRP